MQRFKFKNRHNRNHDTEIHFVVLRKNNNGEWNIDDDGTQFWIRSLFADESQTWCNDCEDYVKDSAMQVDKARRDLIRMFDWHKTNQQIRRNTDA